MFLLDTNIIIYSIKGNERALKSLERIKDEPSLISVISKLEVLYGAIKEKKSVQKVFEEVDVYAALAVDNAITLRAFEMMHKDGVNLKFKDLLIAATAKEHGFTLVTADKDFKKLKGIDVKLIAL